MNDNDDYRPFETVEEVECAFGKVVKPTNDKIDARAVITGAMVNDDGSVNIWIGLNNTMYPADMFFHAFTFLDGSPAGVRAI